MSEIIGVPSTSLGGVLGNLNKRFSRDVISAMLVNENKRSVISFFVRPPEVVHFSVVIGVPRGWLKTSYIDTVPLFGVPCQFSLPV